MFCKYWLLLSKCSQKFRLNQHRSYLFVCAFECKEHVAHVARNKGHGGEGHTPANPLAPGWEHIVTHGEGNHLHCTKQEDSLDKTDKEIDVSTYIIVLTDNINLIKTAEPLNQNAILLKKFACLAQLVLTFN